ncbi:MAG: methyltransferase [Christensenellales bacterium]
MGNVRLKEGEKLEDLQNGYQIIQNKKFFSFGTDAVLLAHFAAAKPGDYIADIGTGCGIIPILLCARYPRIFVTGIEVQQELADMAERSVAINGLEKQIRIVRGDLKEALCFVKKGADLVVANPPYIRAGAGAQNESVYRNIAKREVMCTLDDVICAAAALLGAGGRLCMIYTTGRFAELMVCMKNGKIEPKLIQFIAPMRGKAPNLVLVEGRKGAREGVRMLPTLEIFESGGVYTEQLKKIYGKKGDG